jgi:hypothetical protein
MLIGRHPALVLLIVFPQEDGLGQPCLPAKTNTQNTSKEMTCTSLYGI